MKLIFISGPDKGQEVELRPPFLSIGRESDNDTMLDEEQVSRYHAKIELDGSIWIINDLGSRNGVKVNGHKINQSAPLSINDEIEIGRTAFCFTDDAQAAGATAEPGAAFSLPDRPARAKKHGGEKDKAKKMGPGQRIAALAVLLFAVAAVVGSLVMTDSTPRGKQPKTNNAAPVAITDAPLQVFYQKEISGWDDETKRYNIYFFELSINDNRLNFRVRNVNDGLDQKKSAELSRLQTGALKDNILTAAFVQAASRPPRQRQNKVNRIRLMVMAGRAGNYVEYLNESKQIPPGVLNVMEKLDDLAYECGVNPLPKHEAFERAEENFLRGRRLYAEREVHPANLYNAKKVLELVPKYLEGFNDPPAFYEEAQDLLKEAQEKFTKMIDELKVRARFQTRADELEAARNLYQEILGLIPDEKHKEYRNALNNIRLIKRELERQRK